MFSAIRRIFRFPLDHKFPTLVSLIILMSLLRLLWGWSVRSHLHSTVSAIRARGEPIEPSQITHEVVPDTDNAVSLYRQAVRAMAQNVDSPRNSNLSYSDYFPRSPQWIKLAEASEKANASSFALVRAARQRSRAQFGTSLADDPDLHYLGDLRTFANVIGDGAEYAHLKGNDAEALERFLDVLHIARTLNADDYLICHIVASGIDALACHSIHLIAPGLSAPDARIRTLIDQLLDEKLHRATFKRTLLNERIRLIRLYAKNGERNWLLAPLANRDALRMLSNFDILLPAADCTNFPQASQILKHCQWESPPQQARFIINFPYQTIVPRYSRWFYNGIDLSPWVERSYRILAERRITAVSLACQLYRMDHGRFPESLDQLVP